jgi:hypothetical protein
VNRMISVWTVAFLSLLLVASLYGVSPARAQDTHPDKPPVKALNSHAALFPPGIIQAGVIFCDDAEKGNLGWTETVEAGDSQPGPLSTWHITALNSYSPTHSWWIGNEGQKNYDTSIVDRILTSPPISVGPGSATLSYHSSYATIETESGYDYADVYVKTSTGLLLAKEIQSWDPEDGKGWLSFAWDISSVAGQTIHIVLAFDTFDLSRNTGPGWFVDDICVTGMTHPAAPVGGIMTPANNLEILAPYLALAGLVAVVSTVIVAKRKRD